MIPKEVSGCEAASRTSELERRIPAGVVHAGSIRLPEPIGVTAQFDEVGIYTRTFDLSRHRHKVLVEV